MKTLRTIAMFFSLMGILFTIPMAMQLGMEYDWGGIAAILTMMVEMIFAFLFVYIAEIDKEEKEKDEETPQFGIRFDKNGKPYTVNHDKGIHIR